MDIKLQSLSLKNFKGIKEYTLDINGQDATISAANGLGKTTLYDAFLWLLFDKDSNNRKDFSVKTTDVNGQEIHGLEHEVEGILEADGQELKLRKMLVEKWVKKRGQAEQEFTGRETSYWIDDVPVKKNQYVKRIEDLVPENIFKLLTNPYYFNTQIKWEDRRKLLMEICGDISDTDVIASDDKLFKLTAILKGKSIDDYKKIIAERIKNLNKDIEKIPVRIDELNTTMLNSTIVDYATAEVGLADYKAKLNAIEQELAGANETASQMREKQQQLFKLERDIEDRKKELERQADAGNEKLLKEKQRLDMKLIELSNEQIVCDSTIELKQVEIGVLDTEMDALREKYKEIFTTVFVTPDENEFICPTCKRELPVDDIERQVKEMETSFNSDKQIKLARINTEGKLKKERKGLLESEGIELGERFAKIRVNIHEINERLVEINQELTSMGETKINYGADMEYCDLLDSRKALRVELDKPIESQSAELLQKKQEITAHIEDLNKVLSQREVTEKTKARIQELKDEERRLAQQISEAEGERFLTEQFVKAKVNLLEGSINSRFKMVRFKLFDTQINGGVTECCDTLVNTNGSWVPFTDANTGGKVNAGLDIILTLSNHYGIQAPIFIDNAESITSFIGVDSQFIKLVVDENYKELHVEVG